MNVLYVDDDATQRELVAEVLTDAGHTVTAVATVDDFTAAYGAVAGTADQYDVVVCDHDLGDPAADGVSLLQAVACDHGRILFSGSPPRHVPAGIAVVTKDRLLGLVDEVARAG